MKSPKPTSKGRPPKLVPLWEAAADCDGVTPPLIWTEFISGERWRIGVAPDGTCYTYCESE